MESLIDSEVRVQSNEHAGLRFNVRNLVWHYTTGEILSLILSDGFIKPATLGVEAHERPAVWFSCNQVWEATASKGFITPDGRRRTATKDEMIRLAGGLARIGVLPQIAPFNWTSFRKQSGITPHGATLMLKGARAMGGDANEWRVSFDPVESWQWITVQAWKDCRWVSQDSSMRNCIDGRP